MTNFSRACLKSAGLLALAVASTVFPPAHSSAQAAGARPQEPTSSPNGKIVFQSTQGGDGFVNEIYTVDADGKRQVRLTYNEFDDQLPVWSPQGDRIAFLSMRNTDRFDIYLMNPDGTGERPLRDAAHGGPFETNNIHWSPDGRRIMFAANGKITVVEVLDAAGNYSDAAPQNLSADNPEYAFDNNAAWSPDGSRLVFISNACGGCFPDVFVINADGTGRARVTTNPDVEARPMWTPDGRIAYDAWRDPGQNVYVSNVDGTGEQLLTGLVSDVLNPVWSPDGARVAFGSAGGPVGAPRAGLYVMNADGTGLRFLTDEVGANGLFWSPDGSTIVSHVTNSASAVDIVSFSVNGDSHRVTNLTKTRKADENAWSWQRLPTP